MKWLRLFSTSLVALLLLLGPMLSMALSARQVYQKVRNSIYTVYSLDHGSREVRARGSAVAIAKDVLVTNCHIVLSGDYLIVKLPGSKKSKVARLYYKNENRDLCFLEIPGANFRPVKLRPSSRVSIGEIVYAVGNPKGTEKTLSKGIISNKHKVKGGVWLQTDAAIYFGSSGGGLFDEEGNLIGITTKMGGNFGFAIPTEWITEVVSQPRPKNLKTISRYVKNGKHDTDIDPEVIKGLSHIGTYGDDQISLYRNNKECFLLVKGNDTNGEFVSIVVWNPKYPGLIVVFPATKTASRAISIVHQAVIDKRSETQKSFRSKSKLYVGRYQYNLYGTRSKAKTYPFLLARIQKNPSSILLSVSAIKAVFKADTNAGNSTVVYPLGGFSEAVSAYNAKCK